MFCAIADLCPLVIASPSNAPTTISGSSHDEDGSGGGSGVSAATVLGSSVSRTSATAHPPSISLFQTPVLPSYPMAIGGPAVAATGSIAAAAAMGFGAQLMASSLPAMIAANSGRQQLAMADFMGGSVATHLGRESVGGDHSDPANAVFARGSGGGGMPDYPSSMPSHLGLPPLYHNSAAMMPLLGASPPVMGSSPMK